MISYVGYVKFRDYEYLCWVKFGIDTHYYYYPCHPTMCSMSFNVDHP